MFQDTVQRARRDVEADLAGHGHCAWFRRMMKLPVAPGLADLDPAVRPKLPQQLLNFDRHPATKIAERCPIAWRVAEVPVADHWHSPLVCSETSKSLPNIPSAMYACSSRMGLAGKTSLPRIV